MTVLMKYILAGLFAVLLAGCRPVLPTVRRTAAAMPSDHTVWNVRNRSETGKNSYRVVLKMPDKTITGICILKKNNGEWRGTFINEMGAGAFDFIVTDEKCELLNVVSVMDKWYVKKTVAADLYFFFNVDNPKALFRKDLERFEQDGNLVVNYKKKQILAGADGSVLLMNNRHHLQYEWRKMVEIQ
jgi:hypothetical protein